MEATNSLTFDFNYWFKFKKQLINKKKYGILSTTEREVNSMPNEFDYLTIGRSIRQIRIASGITQTELANALKCSVQHLSNLENGRKTISLEILVKVRQILAVSADDLLAVTPLRSFDPYVTAISVRLQNCPEKEKRLFLKLLKICKQLMEQA